MGWKFSKALGYDVFIDDKGKVVRTISDDGQKTLYPYRAHMVQKGFGTSWQQDGWDNCSGYYTPSYLAKLMREDKAMWA